MPKQDAVAHIYIAAHTQTPPPRTLGQTAVPLPQPGGFGSRPPAAPEVALGALAHLCQDADGRQAALRCGALPLAVAAMQRLGAWLDVQRNGCGLLALLCCGGGPGWRWVAGWWGGGHQGVA